MAEEPDKAKLTKDQALETLLLLGQAIHGHANPKSILGLPRSIKVAEAKKLLVQITELTNQVETAACNIHQRNLRAVLNVRRDEIPDATDIRVIAYVAWHSLASETVGISVTKVANAVGLGSIREMVRARHAIRQLIIGGDVLLYKDGEELLPGRKLVRLLTGDNRLPVIWTEESLFAEKEAWKRKNGDPFRRMSSSARPQRQSTRTPSAPQMPLKTCESPRAIFNALSKTVLGMDDSDTLRRFSVAMSLHMRRANLVRQKIVPTTPCQTLCIAGESGVGKTFMVEEFCKMANLPYVIGNLAEVTSSGYAGLDLTDTLRGLFRNGAKRDEVEAGSIVFFDEADKRKINDRHGDFDCTGAGLQAELLRMLEVTDVQLGGRRGNSGSGMMLSTRGFAFCLAGCFPGVTEAMTSKKRHLGFGCDNDDISHAPDIREALTSYFLPELCNRISTILYIRPPSLRALMTIATAPHGVLEKQNQALGSLGLVLKPDQAAIKAICSYAHSSKTYARGVRSLLQALAEEAIFDEWKGELVIGAEEVRKAIDGLRRGPEELTQ